LINELEFCRDSAYIETEHTLAHFRDVLWDTRLFDRTYRREGAIGAVEADKRILDKADGAWRKIVARQEPFEVEPGFAAELDRIVDTARRELAR